MSDFYEFNCPHCDIKIIVEKDQVNCQIFRCGISKNGQPINPHMPKAMCDYLYNNGLIYGCSKPFKFDGNNVSKCDYI